MPEVGGGNSQSAGVQSAGGLSVRFAAGYEKHGFYLSQIEKCDARIAGFLEELVKTSPVAEPAAKQIKRANKNSIEGVDLNRISYQYFQGVDAYDIPGVSHSTVLILMNEIGPEGLEKFPTAKHFLSWLRLAPNNKISVEKHFPIVFPKEVTG